MSETSEVEGEAAASAGQGPYAKSEATERVGPRSDGLPAVWAVLPAVLPVISAFARGAMTEADVRRSVESSPDSQAAARRGMQIGGGGVAVIPLQGLITPKGSFYSMLFGGGGGLQAFRANLAEAVGNDDIGSIVINVDSPGGRADLVAETAADIRDARDVKPVTAVANTMAGSAAYWLAAQADEIVISPSGSVGSIGVFAVHEEFSEMDKKIGIKTTLVSAGKYKTEGNPYEPLSDAAKAAWQVCVDECYDMFVADVAAGRKVSESLVRAGYGEGRMVNANRAVSAGLADRIDTLEGAITQLVRGGNRGPSAEAPPSSDVAAGQVAGSANQLAQMREQIDRTTSSLKEG